MSGRCHFLVKEMSAHSRRPSVSERPPAIPRFALIPSESLDIRARIFERWDSTSLSRLGSMDSADAQPGLVFQLAPAKIRRKPGAT